MISPKEKALELFEQFKPIAHANLFSFREESHVSNCKKGALIVVNEILSVIPIYEGNLNPKWKYYDEVKKEIEKF